ncbi:phenylacetate--CoA ligase family protein [Bradyrhizobium sp. USDA 3256]
MRHFAFSPRDCAQHVLPETILHPCTVDDVLALPSFLTSLVHAQTVIGCRIDELSHDIQAAIVERRLSQLVSIARINPLWRRRIDSAVGTGPVDNYEQFKTLPLTDKEAFQQMFTETRPGMVVPIDRCGFEIVASGGTSSGKPSETVYSLDELQETYRWAGDFMGRHIMARHLSGRGAKWVATTLADYQMWSSGTMVGGVLQKIPRVNYIGAGPTSREVFQRMMSYPGPKAIMGITRSIALLASFADGLTREARDSFRIALYGSGVLTPKVRADLRQAYPSLIVLSYFAATQAETIGLQLDPESPVLTAVPGLHLVEVVRPDGQWTEIGEEGELVVTRLFGNATPVLRYKIGDRVIRRPDLQSPGLNAVQFEYVGRSGDFMHIGDTQYSAPQALAAITAEFRQRQVLDIDSVATDAQFQIDRANRQLHLVIGTPEAASLPTQVAMRLGPQGSSPLIIAGLLRSLSVFDALEANETSLRSSGYSFAIRLVDPRNADLVRTAFDKVPLVVDRI